MAGSKRSPGGLGARGHLLLIHFHAVVLAFSNHQCITANTRLRCSTQSREHARSDGTMVFRSLGFSFASIPRTLALQASSSVTWSLLCFLTSTVVTCHTSVGTLHAGTTVPQPERGIFTQLEDKLGFCRRDRLLTSSGGPGVRITFTRLFDETV